MRHDVIRQLRTEQGGKIVMLVADGIGGLPGEAGVSELEAAATPNLDNLAVASECGLHVTCGHGITPGSGPAHLALFGYDPYEFDVGRGVLSALGVNFDLRPGDIAARGNFCTLANGLVTDRRAGRIASDIGAALCEKLSSIEVPGVELFVVPEKEYRFAFVLRGDGLSGDISDTDPGFVDVAPNRCEPTSPAGAKTAEAVNAFCEAAMDVLKDDAPANFLVLRGLSERPDWPMFPDLFGITSVAVAEYPMYRGLARLIGMDVLETGAGFDAQLQALKDSWNKYDFFYLHFKKTDSAGEDGDFDAKVERIEELDAALPTILGMEPDVLIVTGDHSTPAVMSGHSRHPIPIMIHSKLCRPDAVMRFAERDLTTGGLGPSFPALDIMAVDLNDAGRLKKFGA